MFGIIAALILTTTPEKAAVAMASADAAQLAPIDRTAMRYVLIDHEQPSEYQAKAFCYMVNVALNRSATIYHPTPVQNGRMFRLDRRRLCPKQSDLENFDKTWESMTNNPHFHVTRPSLVVKVKPYKASDGRTYDFVCKDVTSFAAHAGIEEQAALSAELQTAVPIVRADWLICKALSTTRGGLYYDFTGIRGLSQTQFLAKLGASETRVASLRSDERSAIFRSKVTGKPRLVIFMPTEGVRASVGPSWITFTQDIADEDIKAGQHPMRNLIKFDDRAREFIGVQSNGFPIAALYNDADKLQDTVPDNIARDSTIPSPHTSRLEAIISCIRCHGPHDFYQPFQNDVQALTMLRPGQPRLNILGDLTQSGSYDDLLDRLAGLYSGDLSKPLRLARNAHAESVFLATRQTPSDAAANVSQVYGSYVYDEITPARAIRELGSFCDDEDTPANAVKAFNALVPLLPANGGIAPEDPVIAALRAGLSVVRSDWETVYADAALRVEINQKGK